MIQNLVAYLIFVFNNLISFIFSIPKKYDKIIVDNLRTDEFIEDEIDVIITWADSSDQKWIDLKRSFQINHSSYYYDKSNNRYPIKEFSDLELFYCVSTINKYMPWVRNIFITSSLNQKPKWVNLFKKIKMVDHTEFIPLKYLPTFNSHTIECHIHKIKNLSEKFIYFNDDMYVNKYVKKSFFFHKNLPIIPGIYKRLHNKYVLEILKWYAYIIKFFRNNSNRIKLSNFINYRLIKKDGCFYIKPCHVATPLTKSMMFVTETKFKCEWEKACTQFRTISIRPIYLTANFSPLVSKYGNSNMFYNVGIENLDTKLNNSYLFCINNIHSMDNAQKLKSFFATKNIYYPPNIN